MAAIDLWNLPLEDFYRNGFIAYLILSVSIAVLFGRDPVQKPQTEIITSDRVIKKQTKQEARVRFPQGKVAYCTYCDRYLDDEEKFSRHQFGKRHIENAAGAATWHEFRLRSQMQKPATDLNPEVEDSKHQEPDWQTVENSKRKPQKSRKQG